jgi:hypothetical protein
MDSIQVTLKVFALYCLIALTAGNGYYGPYSNYPVNSGSHSIPPVHQEYGLPLQSRSLDFGGGSHHNSVGGHFGGGGGGGGHHSGYPQHHGGWSEGYNYRRPQKEFTYPDEFRNRYVERRPDQDRRQPERERQREPERRQPERDDSMCKENVLLKSYV